MIGPNAPYLMQAEERGELVSPLPSDRSREFTVSRPDIRNSGSSQLGSLLGLATAERISWGREELGAILRHQLAAPVQFDLGNLSPRLAEGLRAISSGQGLLVKSFADLLHHPHPPVELLELSKEFARAYWNHPASPLPREVAMLLYFASIAAALTRCRQRITSLDNQTLGRNFGWFLDQPWLDEPSRELFREALTVLDSPVEESP